MHAHPDDETLSTGGLIAAFAAAGRPAHVVTCTRGERGEVIALPGTTSEGRAGLEGDGAALGAYRETELARALTALAGGADGAIRHSFLDGLPGVSAQVNGVVDADSGASAGSGSGVVSGAADGVRYEDSGMAWVAPGVAGPAPDSPPTAFARVPLDESAGRLAALIRECRPAVVATYEPGGGYGHPDHVRAHEVTVRALRLAADPAWEPGDVLAGEQDGGVGQRGKGEHGSGVGQGSAEPVRGGEAGSGVGRRSEPWAGAELWQAVAPAAEVRAARATLAALPEAQALAAAHALALPDPAEDLPPFAKEGLPEWSAERQVVGSPDYRSSDGLPITRIGPTARVEIRGVLGSVVGAMRAHATQVQHAGALPEAVGAVAGWYALSNGVLAPILTTETYAVVDPLR
ncbi:PIG-L family deacetylase [Promicromonospora sukumoe]|uniref:PIG-L family deacetylase n=1 Tax=Promicromonospora sukumoe TaxID=88382 RepID=UPI0003798067|nr:PIG-L family deacetylase [Promicromonospora sukumoe]